MSIRDYYLVCAPQDGKSSFCECDFDNKMTSEEVDEQVINKIEITQTTDSSDLILVFLSGAGAMLAIAILVGLVCYC